MSIEELQRLKNKYNIIGNDAALNRALEVAMAVAPTDLSVLITGESGVGKDTIPKIIHDNSARRSKKFFAINCGAIPEGTVESELFGHEKGAYTGAADARKGYFEEADGGTIFLDEIGELPMPFQAKLLRVIQSGEFIRMGSTKVQKTDVRVIAATNVNIVDAVGRGKFRADLYYRLNTIPIKMPSLRERQDDIHLLFRKFSVDFAEKYGFVKINLSYEAIQKLKAYRWPGNIRQLKNVAETISLMESSKQTAFSGRTEISAETLMKYIPKDEENLLPAMVENRNSGGFTNDEKTQLLGAVYSLSQRVAKLEEIVAGHNRHEHGDIAQIPAQLKQGSAPHEPEFRHTEHTSHDVEWQKSDSKNMEDIDEQAQEEEEVQEQLQPENLSVLRNKEDLVRKALAKYGGNRKLAARELGFSDRTLYRYLKKFNIE